MTAGGQLAVIGAGLGGLSAAALLARGGLRVTVFEKGCRAGGKMNVFSAGGFTWDTGPSLVTMPHILRGLWRKLSRAAVFPTSGLSAAATHPGGGIPLTLLSGQIVAEQILR